MVGEYHTGSRGTALLTTTHALDTSVWVATPSNFTLAGRVVLTIAWRVSGTLDPVGMLDVRKTSTHGSLLKILLHRISDAAGSKREGNRRESKSKGTELFLVF